MLTIEGGEAFGGDAAQVDRFADLGVRMAALVWNNENGVAHPALTGSGEGLTPLGRDICDLMLAVNRRYGRADYLPCIAWGTLARRCGALEVGDGVRIAGRLQSRGYTKVENGVSYEKTAYEVSVMQLEAVEDA